MGCLGAVWTSCFALVIYFTKLSRKAFEKWKKKINKKCFISCYIVVLPLIHNSIVIVYSEAYYFRLTCSRSDRSSEHVYLFAGSLNLYFKEAKRCSHIQGLYNKFRELGYHALTMLFPLVFVTGGWRGECVWICLGIVICLLPPGGWGQGAQFVHVILPRRSWSCSKTSKRKRKKTPAKTFRMFKEA